MLAIYRLSKTRLVNDVEKMPQSTEMKKHILKKYLICKKTIAIN